jgi:hypothetical protein
MSQDAALPLTKEEKLGMLGLAKQGTLGDVSEAKPGKFDVKVRGGGTAGVGAACVFGSMGFASAPAMPPGR